MTKVRTAADRRLRPRDILFESGLNPTEPQTAAHDPGRTLWVVVIGNHSGSSGNCWTPSGMATPGNLRDVQM